MRYWPAIAAALLCVSAVNASAADYPDRPVRIIVPSPAGGATDVVARIVTEAISRKLGRQWAVIENVGTAGGAIGVERVARSAPDGYTLLVGGAGNLTVAPAIRKAAYDTVKDFAPVVLLNRTPVIAVANPSAGIRSMKDLIDRAKEQPGKLNFAIGGQGILPHLVGMAVIKQAGIDIVPVPYRGEAAATTDLLAGHITIGFIGLPTVASHLKSGALVPFGVSSAEAYPEFATIPPIGQTFPGFDMNGWYALLAPAGTPQAVIDWLNKAYEAALSEPDVKEKLSTVGALAAGGPPDVLKRMIEKDLATYREIAQAFNIRGD
jgi:tripartite-type tricarboxylate transporter receptor subunit TctC